jgi:hypothetical protein
VTALVLGRAPDPLTILLTPGAEFTARLVSRRHGIEQPWPEGTRLTTKARARLWLAPPGEAGGEFLWASGGVQIRG